MIAQLQQYFAPKGDGENFFQLLPLFLLTLGPLAILAIEVLRFPRKKREGFAAFITVGALTLALALVCQRLWQMHIPIDPKNPVLDPARRGFAILFFNAGFNLHVPHLVGHGLALCAALMSTFLSISCRRKNQDGWWGGGEYYALLMLMPLGAMLMISGANLMTAFLGLEILSLSLYILTSFRHHDPRGLEAGLKYFLLGAFAAAFFVFGMALIYAGKGTVDLPVFRHMFDQQLNPTGLAAIGGAMLFIALLFKASLFPFQMWTPDVYQGAPTPVTALMSTGTKAAAFVLMIMVSGLVPRELVYVIPVIALLTMAAGNLGAIRQLDLKRMLAYSGIAHAGYLLVGINSLYNATNYTNDARIIVRFIFLYLAAYVLANLGAFGIIAFLEKSKDRGVTLETVKGLGRRHPLAAGLMTLFLISLGGIPPTAGFAGKFFLFSQAIRQGDYLLAAFGLLLSVVSLYYYLKVVVYMYMHPAREGEPQLAPAPLLTIPLGISAIGVLLLGIFPNSLLLFLWGLNS